jgi:hypothetical protein
LSRRSTGLVRAVASAGIILLAASSARVRGDARGDHPIPGAKPASQSVDIATRPKAGETLRFDLGCDTASGGRLLRLLAGDRIKVVWADTGAGGDMTIGVTMPAARFKAIFNGKLVKREAARSSCDGFATELFIERYVIPKKYKGSLRWVRLPDPQIE